MKNGLQQDQAIVRTVVDEKKVDAALEVLVAGAKNFDGVVQRFVEMALGLNGDERELLRRKIEKKGVHTDRALRALACATRALAWAKHLYADGRVLTWQTIRDAKSEALAVIADPDHEFVLVEDDGTSRVVLASRLNYRTAGRVWDLNDGERSEAAQRKAIRRRTKKPSAKNGEAIEADLVSAEPCGDGTQVYVFLVGGEEVRYRLPVAKVRKMSGG